MASASETPIPAIALLAAGHEDTVRDVIDLFNETIFADWTVSRRERVPA